MIEPEAPVTFFIEPTPFPALTLVEDLNMPLNADEVVMRHRQVKQQYKIISREETSALAFASAEQAVGALRKATRGHPVIAPYGALRGRTPLPGTNGVGEPSSHVADGRAANPGVENDSAAVGQPAKELVHRQLQTKASAPGITINIGTGEVRLPVQQSNSILPDVTVSEEPSCVLPVQRHEHMIRGLKDKTVWFSSRGDQLLLAPMTMPSSQLHHGDLFVHVATGNRRQVWLWNSDHWVPVDLHHPHPYLRGYVLNILSNGEPSWVTKDTIRTYISRIKKRERERDQIGKTAKQG